MEFDCVDCGVHVYSFGRPPADFAHRCAICQWVSELPDAETRASTRAHLLARGVIGTGEWNPDAESPPQAGSAP